MFTKTFTRGTILLATAGALIGLGTCSAFAATPAAGTGNPTASSKGFNLTNDTPYGLVLTSVSGDNEGVPQEGTAMAPGDHQNFEVTYRFNKNTTVTADYAVWDNGQQIATAEVAMKVGKTGQVSDSASFTYPGSNLSLVLDTAHAETPKIMSPGQVQHLGTDDPQAQQLIAKLCQSGNDAKCTFTPTDEEHTYNWVQMAASYNQNSPESSVTADSGWTTDTTDSWGVTVGAKTELAGVVSIGVSASYGHETSFGTDFSTSYETPVEIGHTGYIFGAVPVVRDTGTLAITLGNNTWDIDGVHFDSPDGHQTSIDHYLSTDVVGNYPIDPTPPTFPSINS